MPSPTWPTERSFDSARLYGQGCQLSRIGISIGISIWTVRHLCLELIEEIIVLKQEGSERDVEFYQNACLLGVGSKKADRTFERRSDNEISEI